MATASKGIDDELLNCSICLSQFVAPKYLPCLHTFCEACLQTYISAEISKRNTDSFPCPVCRQQVKPVDANSPPEKWAAKMPNNCLLASLLDYESQSDQSNGRLCEPCKEANEENKVAFWCMECPEGLCESCASSHRRMKMSKNHKIVPINEICEDSLKMADIDEPCQKHKGKVFEVYCIDHSELCCVICLATKHRECKHIKTVDEMADVWMKNKNTEEFSKQLAKIERQVRKLSDSKQQNMDCLDKKCSDILTSVTDLVSSAKENLDRSLNKFREDLNHLHKRERQNLIDRRDVIEGFGRTVTTNKDVLDTVVKNGSVKQVFVTSEKIKLELSGQVKQLKLDLKDDKKIDFDYYARDVISDVSKLSSAGTIKLKSTSCIDGIKSVVSIVQCCCNTQVGSVSINEIEAVKVRDIKSEGSYFTGGQFMDNGNIIFADSDRRELKIFDMISGDIIKIYKFENVPVDVAVFPQDIIYVTFNNGSIKKYAIGDGILLLKDMKGKSGKTRDITISLAKDKIIIGQKEKIEIVDDRGNVVRSIPRQIKESFSHVSTSNDMQKLFYMDNHEIVCCSLNGQELIRFQNKAIQNEVVHGIAVGHSDHIYVCCYRRGEIHIVSKDGSKAKVLLSKSNGILAPIAIGFDKTGKYFFVTFCRKNRISAQIYKIVCKT